MRPARRAGHVGWGGAVGRRGNAVELTGAGRLFLDESRQVLAQVDKAVLLARRAHLGELGELKIGFTSSAPFTSTIPSSIHAFRKAYPDVHLDLQEMSSRQVLKALLEESLQVGVIRPLALPDAVHWVECSTQRWRVQCPVLPVNSRRSARPRSSSSQAWSQTRRS